jgi:hypothetical protein
MRKLALITALGCACLFGQKTDLARQVKGTLPGANGGTGLAVSSASQLQHLRRKPNVATAAYEFASPAAVVSSDYNFPAQTPGGSLSAGVAATVTLTPVPLGVNHTDAGHYLYISAGTGTAEAVLITGGTALSGATSGTITFTPANTHTGAWTVQSATAGIQEAIITFPLGADVYIPVGTYTIYAPIFIPYYTYATSHPPNIRGGGRYNTTLLVDTDFPATATSAVFVGTATYAYERAPQFSDFGITFQQPDSTNRALYRQQQAFYFSDTSNLDIERISIRAAWNGIVIHNNSGRSIIRDIEGSSFNYGIELDGLLGESWIDRINWSTVYGPANGLTTNQALVMIGAGSYTLKVGRVDDLHISNFFSIANTGIWYAESTISAGNYSFGQVVNSGFDTYNGIRFDGGSLRVSNSYFSAYAGAYYWIKFNGFGQFKCSNCDFTGFGGATAAVIPLDVNFTTNDPRNLFALNGTYIDHQNYNFTTIKMTGAASAAGTLRLQGVDLWKSGTGTYTDPVISVTTGAGGNTRVFIEGVSTEAMAGGSGTFYSVGNDITNFVRDLTCYGWTVSIPANAYNASVYEDGSHAVYDYRNFRPNLLMGTVGTALTVSGNTIAPVAQISHVGAGLIKTITVPAGFATGCLKLIPDAAFTYDATGNIVVPIGGGTAVINKTMEVCWDGSKWTPSY